MNVSKEPPAGLRFPRTAKLLKHSDFQRVYKSGKRHFSGAMTVFYLPRPDAADAGPRIGITVSRALGGAVERNRIKRRIREAIRLHLTGITFSMDVVFNPKKVAATVEFAALEQEVSRSFEVIQKAAARMPAKERSNAE